MPADRVTLEDFLAGSAADGGRGDVASAVTAIADAAKGLADLTSQGALARGLTTTKLARNADGDAQKELDVLANEHFIRALKHVPVAAVASEELDEPLVLDPQASLAVAIDPLDGSSNIDTNVSIGTIFSIRPARLPARTGPLEVFLQPGSNQLAAGFVIYGPQTSLVLTVDHGVQVFTLDRAVGAFILVSDSLTLPTTANEYAINGSNYRHWEPPVRAYVDDCIQGVDGPLGKNFNTRWIASLVADAYRILVRGGIFLYPGDLRPNYAQGRLRLIYEAHPIALVVERAGGAATDGVNRILDLRPHSIHQRTPLVFGSLEEVERLAHYYADPNQFAARSPLFGRRGLLRM